MSKKSINRYAWPDLGNQEENLKEVFRQLKLGVVAEILEEVNNQALREGATYLGFLEKLFQKVYEIKEENRQQQQRRNAHFPFIKTLADFDFSHPQKINKQRINELASCRYLKNAENVIFYGPTGVGKTHLTVSLGIEGIRNGHRTRYFKLRHLQELVDKTENDIKKQHDLLINLLRYDLLILDEMDLYKSSEALSTFLAKLLSDRHEKSSTIFAANQSYSAWRNLFGNGVRAETILDRVYEYAIPIEIIGESYRLKRARERNAQKETKS